MAIQNARVRGRPSWRCRRSVARAIKPRWWDVNYARGGGESGTETRESGSDATDWMDVEAHAGAGERSVDASTAAGPTRADAIAASGSEVLRQEQECDPGAPWDFVRVWCIGHICPSPWSQVHSAPIVFTDVIEQSVVGTAISSASCNTSQPAATRPSRGRIQRILLKGYHATSGVDGIETDEARGQRREVRVQIKRLDCCVPKADQSPDCSGIGFFDSLRCSDRR